MKGNQKMALQFQTFRIGSPRGQGEGLRIGTVRYLPRGVPKTEYRQRDLFDVWLPILAPSRELFRVLRSSDLQLSTFFRRYRSEMNRTDARQVIQLLAELARQTPIAVGCYCTDESRCHRSALAELIRSAATAQHESFSGHARLSEQDHE